MRVGLELRLFLVASLGPSLRFQGNLGSVAVEGSGSDEQVFAASIFEELVHLASVSGQGRCRFPR